MIKSPAVVDRVDGLSYRDIERLYQRPALRPVVVPGFCREWPAYGHWTLDQFKQRFGPLRVKVDGQTGPLGELIDEVLDAGQGRPSRYLRECYLADILPEVLDELAPIPGDERNRVRSPRLPLSDEERQQMGLPELLISGPGTHFPVLHYDSHHMHAFITQLQGDKEFTVFRPEDGPYLYPSDEQPQASRIDAFDPVDLERFPLFERATPIRFRVNQGDTVFVPSGWWHYTRTLSPSLAITWNSVSRANWRAFSRDRFLGGGAQKGPKAFLKRIYLEFLGGAMSIRERLI